MIADWRRVWGDELPFLFVQLAPHRNTHPAFREAHHRIWQKTPHTAMVVTTDVGDANDIHPTRKRPVGERLALAARALSYGEQIEYSGPVFKSMKVESDRAVVSFTHIGEGLMAKGDLLKGFTMAGTDGWLWLAPPPWRWRKSCRLPRCGPSPANRRRKDGPKYLI